MTANNNTVRQSFEQMLDSFEERRPSIVLFTTFNFSPTFFEDNVLPIICGSSVEEIKGHAVSYTSLNETLRDQKIKVMVFCDRSVSPDPKGKIQYGMMPLGLANGRFHPKIVLMGGRLKDGTDGMLISVASANLSISGWSLNREIISWTRVCRSHIPDLKNLLDWLNEQALSIYGDQANEDGRTRECIKDLQEMLDQPDAIPKPSLSTPQLIISVPGAKEIQTCMADRIRDNRKWDNAIVYSPYWQGLPRIAASLGVSDIKFVPTTNRDGQYDFPLSSLKTREWPQSITYEICSCSRWQPDRFTHAKVFALSKNKNTRLCIGSANSTGPALFHDGDLQNVEAILAYDNAMINGKDRYLVPLSEEHISEKDDTSDEPGAPPLPPFDAALLMDWKNASPSLLCRYRKNPSRSISDVELKAGSHSPVKIFSDCWDNPLSIKLHSRRSINTFTITYRENDNDHKFRGCVLHINAEDDDLGYTERPSIDIVLDELRALRISGPRKPRPPGDPDGGENDSDPDGGKNDSDPDIPEDDIEMFDYFGMYQALFRLRDFLTNNPDENRFAKHGLVSLPRLLRALQLEENNTDRARIRRYLLLTELEIMAADSPVCDEQKVFLGEVEKELIQSQKEIIGLLIKSDALKVRCAPSKNITIAAKNYENWFTKEVRLNE